ncbi:MAG: bifunctional homocysteine S-methyltransferase/methylenetetrahydrofolate reductase [Anaerolineae bacterium]
MLCDGAMGTMLFSRGVPFSQCLDDLNRSRPDLVFDIHRQYIAAGADIIETNTFGANRVKLAEFGLDEYVREINQAGARLAIRAAREGRRPVFVAGSVGPLGQHIAPWGKLSPSEVTEAFREQIAALADAGVDLLILETFSSLPELREAVLVARSVCDLPIVASVTFTDEGRTPLGHTPIEVVTALQQLDVDVIGVNCSTGPSGVMAVIERMVPVIGDTPLLAQPNAGWPRHYQQRLIYPASPDYFADYARRFMQQGVQIVGGCCGTTPEHTAAMRQAVDDRLGGAVAVVESVWESPPPVMELPPLPAVTAEPTELARKLQSGRFVVAVEVDPPRSIDSSRVLDGARMLKEAGADVIDVADSPMARLRMGPWALAHLIQAQVGIETVLHFPTRGRNLLRVQSDLLAAHALGVRNVFVVMGDPPSIGDYPQATDAYDVYPSGLVKLIKEHFNQGVDPAGHSIGPATAFFVGVALNMDPPDLKHELKNFQRKVQAGADFALTQPIYDVAVWDRFIAEIGEPPIPILVGVLPLRNVRHAEFLHNEVPGIRIPDEIMRRMREAVKPEAEGIRIAQELVQALQGRSHGVYIMPPFGRYETAAEVIAVLER